ncbi:MAG: deoxyguanosinetriphosphate triphosphohydrolase [Clostridia bacterium]|nr:deoxyguanosinetriphosphate triphosphohydrolase [Clostridia bacterium]
MNLRERTEIHEKEYLSPYAALSSNTKGRQTDVPKCDLRTEFQRDRDKIIHSKAFRRLKHKTQVFIAPEGDHYRTRLTHTLDVSQISRTIARALRLNEDLTEAIALSHDLGHTPFGHSGERVLDEICPYGFSHQKQSLRVVDILENGTGLNLTYEVRDGIVNHTGDSKAETLEGRIVNLADRIAYINHDIDDAIRAGLIKKQDIPKEYTDILGDTHSARISTMINAVINESEGKNDIYINPDIKKAMDGLRSFMFEKVYNDERSQTEEKRAKFLITGLYEYFITNPHEIPSDYSSSDNHRNVCDFIAGMTDRYAISKFKDIFIPHSWE